MAGVWPLAILVGALGLPPGEAPLRWGCDEEGGAPYCFKRPSGAGFERVGFEVDIVLELRKRLGRAIEFTQYPFDNLVPGLKKRDFDLAMNGLEVTPDRRREVAFTRPYYLYRQQLVRRKGEARFSDYPDLLKALPRARVGTMDGTAAERLLAAGEVEVAGYPAPTEAYRDLALGRLDAVLLDLPMALSYARNDPALEFAGDPFAPGRYAIAVHPDDRPLLQRLNLAIDGMIADGALKAILLRWGLWDELQESRLASATSGGDWELEGDSDAGDWTLARYIPLLLEGALVTVQLTACSFALAMSLGLLVAMARLYAPRPWRPWRWPMWSSSGAFRFCCSCFSSTSAFQRWRRVPVGVGQPGGSRRLSPPRWGWGSTTPPMRPRFTAPRCRPCRAASGRPPPAWACPGGSPSPMSSYPRPCAPPCRR